MSPILTSKHVTCNFLFFCWYFSLDSQERKSLYIWPSPSSLPCFLNTLANFCQLRRKCIRLKVAVTTVLWVLLAVRSKVQLFDHPYCLSLGARSWIVRAPPWKCWRKLVRGDCISICFFQRIFPISPDSSTPKSVPARAAHVFQLLSIQQGNPTSEWQWDALHASPWQTGQLYCHTRSSMPDKRDFPPGNMEGSFSISMCTAAWSRDIPVDQHCQKAPSVSVAPAQTGLFPFSLMAPALTPQKEQARAPALSSYLMNLQANKRQIGACALHKGAKYPLSSRTTLFLLS